MDLRALGMFADIADMGSLTKVAVMRGSVQSALSKQLAALEVQLGGKLFHRTGRGVVLTELGHAILPRAKALLMEAEQLQSDARLSASVPFGQVALGIQSSAARPLVGLLFQRTRERYPGIRIRVMEGFSGAVEEWLANGRIDVGIVNRYGARKTGDEDGLLKVNLCLVGPPGDEATARKEVKFGTLAGVPLALPGLPNGLRSLLDETARKEAIKLSVAIEVDSLILSKDVVAGGGAYTILPMQAVFDEVQSGRLQAAPLVRPGLSRHLVLATTTQRPLTRASREIVRLIRQLVAELVSTGQWQGREAASASRGEASRGPR
jgi:DNA-binding transcriptional LysR family regulator